MSHQKAPKNGCLSGFIFKLGTSLVLQTKQCAFQELKTDWTLHNNSLVSFKSKVQPKFTSPHSKFTLIVAEVSDPMTPFHSRFSCFLFGISVDYMSLCMNSIEHFCSFKRYMGWRRSVHVHFLLSSSLCQ